MVKPLPKDHLRHAAVERLRFIDARLFWEARINRADLIEVFAISPAQAALDFREYLATAGRGVVYDTSARSYVTTARFKPQFALDEAPSVLSTLHADGDPLTAALPQLQRPLDAGIAARVRRAARDGERLLVDYQSFTRAEPAERWIAPSRLVSDGERWHARAWCYGRQAWRDFVLARVLAIRESEPAGALPDDTEWCESVDLVLRPARHLSRSQQASVAREMAMRDGRLVVRLPRAMLIYATERWGLGRPGARVEVVATSGGREG